MNKFASDPEIQRMVKDIDQYAARTKQLKPLINQRLGRPPWTSLAEEFEAHASKMSGSAFGDGLYELADEAQIFERRVEIAPEGTVARPDPRCLTADMPTSVLKESQRVAPLPPLMGLESGQGRFVFSVVGNLPIVFAVIDDTPKIVASLAAQHFDGIYVKGGRRLWQKPTVWLDNVFLFHDEAVGYNYCHWLLDWIPRLIAYESLGGDLGEIRLILTRPANLFQKQVLHRLGVPPQNLTVAAVESNRENSFVGFRSFRTCSSVAAGNLHPLAGGRPECVRFLRNRLGRPSNAEKVHAHQRLIVDRRTTRRLIFDERTSSLLSQLRFKTVYLEDLAFSQQVNLFSSSEAVIAAHGAGLSNLVFAPESAAVLEIFPPNYSTQSFYVTSATLGLQYWCAVGSIVDQETQKPHIRDHDITCATEVIERWIEAAGLA